MIIELTSGRWRLVRHLLVGLLGTVAAGLWFGAAGWVPMLVWTWACRPRPGRRLEFLVHQVAAVQLGPWRTVIECGRHPRERREVFHDELGRAELAALRRALKSAVQPATGRSTSSRSEKPGNRIVSSARGSRSG